MVSFLILCRAWCWSLAFWRGRKRRARGIPTLFLRKRRNLDAPIGTMEISPGARPASSGAADADICDVPRFDYDFAKSFRLGAGSIRPELRHFFPARGGIYQNPPKTMRISPRTRPCALDAPDADIPDPPKSEYGFPDILSIGSLVSGGQEIRFLHKRQNLAELLENKDIPPATRASADDASGASIRDP